MPNTEMAYTRASLGLGCRVTDSAIAADFISKFLTMKPMMNFMAPHEYVFEPLGLWRVG